MSRSFRFIHSFGIELIILKTELLENRLIVLDLEDSKKLFSQGYYGKPIGIPKPKLNEIDVPLILDLIEGYYLISKSKIQIYKNKKKITIKKMFEICQEQYHNFEKKFQVYKTTFISKTTHFQMNCVKPTQEFSISTWNYLI